MGKRKGLAEAVIRQFGFGSLLDAAAASPAFRQRLEQVNAQIERRLREGGSGRPSIRAGYSARPLSEKAQRAEVRQIRSKPAAREPLVDIFEGDSSLRIVAELPGVEEADIKVQVRANRLEISAGSYHREIELPCAVKGAPKMKYRNGVLELRLRRR